MNSCIHPVRTIDDVSDILVCVGGPAWFTSFMYGLVAVVVLVLIIASVFILMRRA